MKNRNESGLFGLLGVVGIVAVYLLLRRFFPGLSTLLLVILGIIALGILAIVAVVMVFAFRKPKNEEEKPAAAEMTALLQSGRASLMECRKTAMYLKDGQIKQQTEEICAAADKLLKTLKEHPENISSVRRCLSYYLSALGKILGKFHQLEESGVLTEETRQNTRSCLGDIRMAVEKQYANLFEDDVLDLTAEMKAMNMVLKGEGLLEEEIF